MVVRAGKVISGRWLARAAFALALAAAADMIGFADLARLPGVAMVTSYVAMKTLSADIIST